MKHASFRCTSKAKFSEGHLWLTDKVIKIFLVSRVLAEVCYRSLQTPFRLQASNDSSLMQTLSNLVSCPVTDLAERMIRILIPSTCYLIGCKMY
jgi:hypothetical protein